MLPEQSPWTNLAQGKSLKSYSTPASAWPAAALWDSSGSLPCFLVVVAEEALP